VNRALALLRGNVRIAVVVAIGMVVVLAIGLSTWSVTAVSFGGLVVGILVGMFIAFETGRREEAARRRR
jgi:hypothetical protein